MKVTLERGEVLDVALVENDRIIGTLSLQLRGLSAAARFTGSAQAPAAVERTKRGNGRRKRGPLSAEARARMAEAQRRRRAKEQGGDESASG
jgi:hypothetical protein